MNVQWPCGYCACHWIVREQFGFKPIVLTHLQCLSQHPGVQGGTSEFNARR